MFFVVLSGKGGTGKSTFSINLALRLLRSGYNVGILDCDITTPNVPRMLGLGKVLLKVEDRKGDERIVPIDIQGLRVISVGLDVRENQGIEWGGERVSKIVEEMVNGVHWGDLDYMVIDMPPGTSDEIISVMDMLPKAKAIIVMIPTVTAAMDAGRVLYLLTKKKNKVLGIVENMSDIFDETQAPELAKKYDVPYLGQIPFIRGIAHRMASGDNVLNQYQAFETIYGKIMEGSR